MYIPLVQKHCINGINKQDAENIREIPELDERVTTLENSGWTDVNYKNYETFQNLIDSFYTEDNKFAKDVVIEYINGITYKTFLIKKGSSANIEINYVDTLFNSRFVNGDNQFDGDLIINTTMNVSTIIRANLDEFMSSVKIFCHDKDQGGSLTGTFSSGKFTVPISRNDIRIFVKGERYGC